MLYVNPQSQSGFKAMELTPGAKGREAEALKQYEQLFLFQMLKEMRKTVPDYGFFDSGAQKAYFEEMMDDFVAGEMAASGQLGVAEQMAKQLHASAGDLTKPDRALDAWGISLVRERKGIAVPDEATGLPVPQVGGGVKLNPTHPAGISLARAHESYRSNQ
ncbi:MAG: rod-binding protein [Candidatus Hydrogenedentes bacterium]|nr:rod-binding protein [Candidatus Hydrogenedentota bacterium]